MTNRRQFNGRLLGAVAAGLMSPVGRAQGGDYPSRPVRIIVPFAAGGGPDILTRKMGVKLAEVLGSGAVVVVDNVVGAGGILAAQNVARAAPDGYTLLLGASAASVAAQDIRRVGDPQAPIAGSVEVPAGSRLVYVSGTVPEVADGQAPSGSVLRFGDTAEIEVSIPRLGGKSITFRYRIYRAATPQAPRVLSAEGTVVCAVVDLARFVATPVPERVVTMLSDLIEDGDGT